MYFTIHVIQPEEWFIGPSHPPRSRSIESVCRERMISTRTINILRALGIRRAWDLCRLRKQDLQRFKGCGPVTIQEIKKLMKMHGLTLE